MAGAMQETAYKLNNSDTEMPLPEQQVAPSAEKPATRAKRIVADLEAKIVRGDLAPGQKLDETVIGKTYDVSRTPVREALRELAASGLVDLEPRIGAIVAQPTVGDVVELFELVGELEAIAARLACERMTDLHQSRIEAAHNACRAAAHGQPEDYLAMNDAFHAAIHDAADNRALKTQIAQLNKRLAPYRRFITFQAGRKDDAEREHEALATALRARDGSRAAQAMAEHVRVLAEDSLALARRLRL